MAPCKNFSHSDSKVSLTQRDLNQEVLINCGSLVNKKGPSPPNYGHFLINMLFMAVPID